MEREIVGKRPHFRPARQNNFYRILVYLSLILTGVWFLLGLQRGQIRQPFLPTPTPTRTAASYYAEAEAYFESGKLDDPDPPFPTPPRPDAIDTYRKAIEFDPQNARAYAELARIMTYSSTMLRNDLESQARLEEALVYARKAVELAPDDSHPYAVLAFVLDWNASNWYNRDQSQDLLLEAQNAATRAYNLDPNNALALAYYAEILVDQLKWSQAEVYAAKALELDKSQMDILRVNGYVQESLGQYRLAIDYYKKAVDITPNMTFLHILIGRLYREGIKNPQLALDYFDQAASINEQLNVNHPLPYIEIAKTYTQYLGEFFVAARNAEKALSFDPTYPVTYAQLGEIFIKARNYEGAKEMLKCAVQSCSAAENEMGKTDVQRLSLDSVRNAYYFVEYGTVLAYLSRADPPEDNFCTEARQVLELVRASYSDDPILVEIIEDSEGICDRVEGRSAPAAGSTEAAPEVIEEKTATPSP